jgi:hypothetical protein
MNRTLYALTLVTFLATPIMLLTGTFGMNFSDMLELVCTFPSPYLHPLPPPLLRVARERHTRPLSRMQSSPSSDSSHGPSAKQTGRTTPLSLLLLSGVYILGPVPICETGNPSHKEREGLGEGSAAPSAVTQFSVTHTPSSLIPSCAPHPGPYGPGPPGVCHDGVQVLRGRGDGRYVQPAPPALPLRPLRRPHLTRIRVPCPLRSASARSGQPGPGPCAGPALVGRRLNLAPTASAIIASLPRDNL